MTWKTKAAFCAALTFALSPAFALAQGSAPPTPKSGDMAVTGNLGFATAIDNDYEGVDPILTGSFEYYTSSRISWRGMLGFSSFDHEAGNGNEVDISFVDANIVFNWLQQGLRPFVTGGVGLYNEDASGPLGRVVDDGIEIGVNGGGGLDIFFQDQWAIKVEGLLHVVSGDGPDGFFSGTVGVKFHF